MDGLVPFYEYRRPDGSTIEVMQKMTDPPLVEDPETGVPLERVFHPIAVHFKGKGFYNTDYGTRNRQREKAAESEGQKKSETSETSSGEGKSSEKTEAKKSDAKSGDSGSSSSSSDSAPSSSKTKD
jgi:predicted nucleic acid-binding Zn ribbon protein